MLPTFGPNVSVYVSGEIPEKLQEFKSNLGHALLDFRDVEPRQRHSLSKVNFTKDPRALIEHLNEKASPMHLNTTPTLTLVYCAAVENCVY